MLKIFSKKIKKTVTLKDLLDLTIAVLIYAVFFALVIKFLPKLIVFFLPLILGFIISLISNRLVTRLEERFKIQRSKTSLVIVILVTLVVVGIIFGIGNALYRQITNVVTNVRSEVTEINGFIKKMEIAINNLLANSPFELSIQRITIPTLTSDNIIRLINDVSRPLVNYFVNFVKNIPSFVVNIIFVILSAYVLIIDNRDFRRRTREIMPKKVYELYSYIKKEVIVIFNGWLKAQFIVIALVFLTLLIGLYIMNVKHFVAIALLIALVDALPIFGSGLFLWPWLLYSILQNEFFNAFIIIILYIVIQVIRNVIQNRIMSADFGLNALITIFALFVGFKLYGFVGLIFAIPFTVLIISLYKFGLFDNFIRLLQKLFLCIRTFLEQKM